MEEKVVEIIEKITGFKGLKQNLDIDLLENEILDSLAFIELISALEDEFDIEIQPTSVNPDTWRSVETITKLIENLRRIEKI